jgi:hypothetical protein
MGLLRSVFSNLMYASRAQTGSSGTEEVMPSSVLSTITSNFTQDIHAALNSLTLKPLIIHRRAIHLRSKRRDIHEEDEF